MTGSPIADAWLRTNDEELVRIRRDLHAHPELGHVEHRTTALLVERLTAAVCTSWPQAWQTPGPVER